jgi:hypothetical protein
LEAGDLSARWNLRRLLVFVVLSALAAQAILAGPTAAQASCGPIDVAFVIDDTESMGGTLISIKAELLNTLSMIQSASGNDYRLALVTFKDDVTVRAVFAPNNQASVVPKIQALGPDVGAGLAEASDEAVKTVVNALPATGPQNIDFNPPFRTSALKIVVLITDAPPGGFDDIFQAGVDDANAQTVASQAKAKGIRVSSVYVPTGGANPTTRSIMQNYATTTGGLFIQATESGAGSGAALTSIIAACGAAAQATQTALAAQSAQAAQAAQSAQASQPQRRENDDKQRRNRERTNRGDQEDRTIEGDVAEVRCDESIPTVVIANRDGLVDVKLLKSTANICPDILVNDYLEATGEKEHEYLFYAEDVSIAKR